MRSPASFTHSPFRAKSMNHSLSLMTLLVSAVSLAGCGGKKEEATTTPAKTSTATTTPVTQPDQASGITPGATPTVTPSTSTTTPPVAGATTPSTSTAPGASPTTSPTTAPSTPPANAAAEIAAAKLVFKRADDARTFKQLSECFSNDSATLVGLNSIGQVLRMSLKPDPKNPAQPDAASAAAAKAQMAVYVKRNNLEKLQKATDQELMVLGKKGRAMLADVDTVVSDLGKQGRLKVNPLSKKAPKPRFGAVSDYNFEAVDASTVKATLKAGTGQSIQVRLEDGLWRLHIGDLVAVRKQQMQQQQMMQQQQLQQQQQGGGAPPMGGGGMAPGAGGAPPMGGGGLPPPPPFGGGAPK